MAKMTRQELEKKHETYTKHIEDWEFYGAGYNGGKEFIDVALHKMPRESQANYNTRKKDAICLNYCTIIVDIFSFYLTEKSAKRDMGELINDELWQMFLKDCDLHQTNFDFYMNEGQKIAATYGSTGILVDKPAGKKGRTRKEEIEKRIYPYLALYTLPNIWDWRFRRDPETNRPILSYLKLREQDGTILIWTEESWKRWKINDGRKGAEEVSLVNEGKNTLKEIPFVWLPNIRNPLDPIIGISDIKEVSLITASIMRDISCGDEVIKYAGFPMLLKPMEPEGEGSDDIVGVTAVMEFDPENPNAKPAWLESEIEEPINAILEWLNRKIIEIYQISHLSGVHAHEKSDQVRSGVAMRYEFQQLGRVLAKKSENLTEAELNVIRLWLKWQRKEEIFKKITITRSTDFSVDDLAEDLNNQLTAIKIVPTEKFRKAIARQVARQVLRDVGDDEMQEIINEIDEADFEQLMNGGEKTGDDDRQQGSGGKKGEPGEDKGGRSGMLLADWAKQQGIAYHEAYKQFKKGTLPFESQEIGKRIYVYPSY